MDKYEVIGLLGEGSFGRVYKAKQLGDTTMVALKVISKRGRSVKEIKGLRRECEIQRHLHHPNIIQMLDSFETDNEIVVITEFAHKELTAILSKEGYLSEDRVQAIVWDLVSALYYLHSHRVLHRDLKPQNILLDSKSNAKLCDFGFARNMSTGTHVLTSIKGTPLYMAPELIEEHPYDHNADLWSLGCIIYELLVGAPPFCTTSILHLIRMIRHEQIQFPTFISDRCISFLKGLLQKDPTKRVAWPEILKHPFIKGHVLILDDVPSKPLTRPLSVDTLQAKEQQRKDCLIQKTQTKPPSSKSTELVPHKSNSKAVRSSVQSHENKNKSSSSENNVEEKLASLSVEGNVNASCRTLYESRESSKDCKTDLSSISETKRPPCTEGSVEMAGNGSQTVIKLEDNLNFCENSSPIENEEWVVFLQRTIEEVMSGEMTSICQSSLANIIVSPLRNSNASPTVLGYVASLLSLPFVVPGVSDDVLEQIKKVYFDIKLIPNLVYASKLLLKHKRNNSPNMSTSSSSPIHSPVYNSDQSCRSVSDLTEEDLHALEYLYLLICHLVHLDVQFLIQFCDSVAVLSMYKILRNLLLLSKRKVRVVVDLIAILTQVLRKLPENSELVARSVRDFDSDEISEEINFIQLLRHSSSLLRERSCNFLQFLGINCRGSLEAAWTEVMRDTLEALVYDSIEDVRNAAEVAVEELKKLPFYDKGCTSE